MKVLSLFDGMSCGQIALKQLGITPELYYASEIDKHAINQTQLNFPDTIQLGNVEKWKEWKIDWGSIDLLLAGSPCQGFSFAGKQLAFNDPRSKLFFVFVDILNHIKSVNPDVMFLLENVKMKKSHMRIISEYCGVFPVNINSNLVSAQNRDRWYWSNIRTKQVGLFGEAYTDIPQPEDKGIFLRDVLESEADEKYYIKPGPMLNWIQSEWRLAKKYTQINGEKALPALARQYANWGGDYVCVASQKGNCDETNSLADADKDNLILQRGRGNNKGGVFEDKPPTLSACSWEQNNLLCKKKVIQLNPSTDSGGTQPYQQDRIYDITDISPTLCAGHGRMSPNVITDKIRRLTPIECSRLQTVPSWYRWECSDTQIYKMLGNGWTVDVIVWILSFMQNGK